MMSEKRNFNSLEELYSEIKGYIKLQKRYATLELIEKCTILLARLTLVFVLIALLLTAMFYFFFALVYCIEPYVGGLSISFLIIGGLYLIIMLMVYLLRKPLIINPFAHFLTRLFLNEE